MPLVHAAARACALRIAQVTTLKLSTLQGLHTYSLHFCINIIPESGDIDKVATSKSHSFFYSFFTIRLTFTACRVKGKNRLHRPKSSPGILFLVVPSPAISAYRGTKGVSSLSTGPSIQFTLKNLRNVLPNRFRAALSWKLCNGYRFPVSF